MAPELACVTYQYCDLADDGVTVLRRPPSEILHHTEASAALHEWFGDPELIILGHNLQFDAAVFMAHDASLIDPIFEAYALDRCTCTKWRMILTDVALGQYRWRMLEDGTRERVGYDLASITARYFGRKMDKDTWRKRYGEFIPLPLAQWPQGAKDYALGDPVETLNAFLEQEAFREESRVASGGLDIMGSEYREARAYLALQLASVWGLRTDELKMLQLEREVIAEQDKVKQRLMNLGLVRPDGSRDTILAKVRMVAVCDSKGIPVPLTKATKKSKGGNVCLDSDACESVQDEVLDDYARFGTLGTILSKDVKILRNGSKYPVHTSFGIAESDRVTGSNPNTMNFARKIE
jgi:hypothetical protein